MSEASRQKDLMWLDTVRAIGYHFSQIGDAISKYAESVNKLSDHSRSGAPPYPARSGSGDPSRNEEATSGGTGTNNNGNRRWHDSNIGKASSRDRESYKRTSSYPNVGATGRNVAHAQSTAGSERNLSHVDPASHGFGGTSFYTPNEYVSSRRSAENRETMSDIHLHHPARHVGTSSGGGGTSRMMEDVDDNSNLRASGTSGDKPNILRHESGTGSMHNEDIVEMRYKRKRSAEMEIDERYESQRHPHPHLTSSVSHQQGHPPPPPPPPPPPQLSSRNASQFALHHIPPSPFHHPPPHMTAANVVTARPSPFRAKNPRRIRVNWSNAEDDVFFKTIEKFATCDEQTVLNETVNALNGARSAIQCKGHFRNLQVRGKIIQSEGPPKKWVVTVSSSDLGQASKSKTPSGHESSLKPSSSATEKNIESPPRALQPPPSPPPPPPPPPTLSSIPPNEDSSNQNQRHNQKRQQTQTQHRPNKHGSHSSSRRQQQADNRSLEDEQEEQDEDKEAEEEVGEADGDNDEGDDFNDDDDEDADDDGHQKQRSSEAKKTSNYGRSDHMLRSKTGTTTSTATTKEKGSGPSGGAKDVNENTATTMTTTISTTVTTSKKARTLAPMTESTNNEDDESKNVEKSISEEEKHEENVNMNEDSVKDSEHDEEDDDDGNEDDEKEDDEDYQPEQVDMDEEDEEGNMMMSNVKRDTNRTKTNSYGYLPRKSGKHLRGMISKPYKFNVGVQKRNPEQHATSQYEHRKKSGASSRTTLTFHCTKNRNKTATPTILTTSSNDTNSNDEDVMYSSTYESPSRSIIMPLKKQPVSSFNMPSNNQIVPSSTLDSRDSHSKR